MKKACRFIIPIIIFCIFSTTYVVAEEILSTKAKIIQVQADIESCTYDEYVEKISKTEESIADLETQLQQAMDEKKAAEEAGDEYGIMRAEAIISSCNEQLVELRKLLSDYKLQRNLAYYYVENRDALVARETTTIEYQIYDLQLQCALLNYQKNYLNSLISQCEEQVRIEEVKYAQGYSTQLLVEEQKTLLQQAKTQFEIADERQKLIREQLAIYGGVEREENPGDETGEIKEDYQEHFLSSSMNYARLKNQISSYENFVAELSEDDEKYKKASLQLDLCRLNKQQYESDLKNYILQIKQNYADAKKNASCVETEIALQNKRIQTNETLFENGKITQIKITEQKTELKRLEYEKMRYIYEANKYYYILDKAIEN